MLMVLRMGAILAEMSLTIGVADLQSVLYLPKTSSKRNSKFAVVQRTLVRHCTWNTLQALWSRVCFDYEMSFEEKEVMQGPSAT